MGTYINPGNEGFARILRSTYVDKTGLLRLINESIDSPRGLICVSRPRRFGKSYAAESIVAYYCTGCDSRALFDGRPRLSIAEDPCFDRHLNAYNVIRLDMTSFTARTNDVVSLLERELLEDIAMEYPAIARKDDVVHALFEVVRMTRRKVVFVVDEWDAVFREGGFGEEVQRQYVTFLRLLFKNVSFTSKAVAAAYLTGILPIKRYGTQSAMTDFWEYTMLQPGDYAPYVGFCDEEVRRLCEHKRLDTHGMRRWYDGYDLPRAGRVFAPYSVIQACERGVVGPYWTSSETYESLRHYIEFNFEGLQADVVRAMGGEALHLDPGTFQNDMTSIHSKSDVLTLLVHLGYLAYDADAGTARIPNEEVRQEFARAVTASTHPRLVERKAESESLLDDIVHMRCDSVARAIERVHERESAPLFYNNEQALRSVIKTALIATIDEYARVEEMPGGRGFADVVYLPRKASSNPALVVELKWNKPADAAIEQIRAKGYPAALRDLDVPILLVDITYDPKSRRHACTIEVC